MSEDQNQTMTEQRSTPEASADLADALASVDATEAAAGDPVVDGSAGEPNPADDDSDSGSDSGSDVAADVTGDTDVADGADAEVTDDADADSDTDESDSDADEGRAHDGPRGDSTVGDEADGASSTDPAARVALLEREGEVAADFIETLLDITDLDGDLDVDIDGDRAAVALVDSDEGRVPRRLVGTDGQVLDALQELTRLAVKKVTGERSRMMLDIAGFRAGRRDELVTAARAAIAEVRESGEKKALAPMTAFERKVVHDEVTAAGLVSESEGVEPNRRIVIQPSA